MCCFCVIASRPLGTINALYARGYYGSVRNYGTVRFWQKVRYGVTYKIFRKLR